VTLLLSGGGAEMWASGERNKRAAFKDLLEIQNRVAPAFLPAGNLPEAAVSKLDDRFNFC
jgi:hypothetical protein